MPALTLRNVKGTPLTNDELDDNFRYLDNATPVSVKNFGAVGDGVTDDTAAIISALASLADGGALYFPKGTYNISRGDGGVNPDTIVSNNVTVYGDGAESLISMYNGSGTIPDSPGNQYYNVFQATGRKGITVRGLAFEGYGSPVSLYNCTDVLVDSIHYDGQLDNASKYMYDKCIHLEGCERVRVVNCNFLNFCFGVYLGGHMGTTKQCVVSNCHFEHTTPAGNYTALFPVGVYWSYVSECIVNSCTFKNIYSSVVGGSTGTGVGYGVYEGDGTSGTGTISNNTFTFEGKSGRQAIAIYTNEMQQCVIKGNVIESLASGDLQTGIHIDSKNQDTNYVVTGNTLRCETSSWSAFYVVAPSARSPRVSIRGNSVFGPFFFGIRVSNNGDTKLVVSENVFDSVRYGIFLEANEPASLKHPLISGNRITNCSNHGIRFNSRIVSPAVIGNVILDGNKDNQTGDSGSAIFFTSYSFGALLANNVIGNTTYGEGLFTIGVCNASSAVDRIFKDITVGNTFIGLTATYNRYFYSSPTNGIYDITRGDFIKNWLLSASGVPGWHCVYKAVRNVTANATSASTTIVVDSTSGVLAGDVVLLVKQSNMYNSFWLHSTWHADTVASVTNGTEFVLTNGIPSGDDGSYVGGTAVCHFARFKAAAAIEA